jgi:hypothetical protein
VALRAPMIESKRRCAVQAEVVDQAQIINLNAIITAAMEGSPAHLAKLSLLGTAVTEGVYGVDASVVSAGIIDHTVLFSGVW